VINTPLRQLTDLFSTLRAIVVAVRRGRKLIVPSANDQLFAGDDVYVMSHTDDVNRTLEVFGKKDEMPKRVVVIGGGNVGFSLLQQLEAVKDKLRLRVIELDRTRAETIAEQLERTIVLHGDALDPAIMDEAGVSTADAILTLTDDDKTNILAAVQAVSIGSKRAISLVNDPSLIPLLGPLGVNAHINPRATTVSSILRHVRHGRVRGVYSIGDSEAEMIEAEVLNNSPMAGKLIRDIEFPEGVMVGAVRKAESTTIPNGDTLLEAGNSLVLFALKEDVPTVDRLLQAPIEFF
jgi:trk system potassium uptake protein TrkA